MAGSRVQVNKPHKSRFSSKSSRNLHKTASRDNSRIGKRDSNGRAARLQRAKMLKEQKKSASLKAKRASCGSTSPPRVIVLFALSASVDLNPIEEALLALLSTKSPGFAFPTVALTEYKLRITVLKAPHGDLLACMEMAKVADLIAFVASTSFCLEGNTSNYIDPFASQCLSVFRALGLPSTAVFIHGLPMQLKKRNDQKKICISNLAPEFPNDCGFYSTDTKEELNKFMLRFKEQTIKVPHWRNQRPYVVAQEVHVFQGNTIAGDDTGKCTLLLSGYLRARNLSVNQSVHVSGFGDFQLGKIETLKDPFPLNARKEQDSMDSDGVEVIGSLVPDPMTQEPLLVENTADPLSGEQTWPTEAEMTEADNNQKQKRIRKRSVPCGTSEYQAAWILDDSDENNSEIDDADDDMTLDNTENGSYLDDDKISLSVDLRDSDGETEFDSMMEEDDDPTKQKIEADIKKIKDAHTEDEEFPDEVDIPFDIPARKRFAKYRGLKSFRTSSWDPKESLPPDYSRIFAFSNFSRTQKQILARAAETDEGSKEDCVSDGSYVRLHIVDFPWSVAKELCEKAKKVPLVVSGLLQHESKMSVLHFSIKKHDTYHAPIKAKEELLFHVGFRQFVARPIFSSDNFNSNKHKMERFLHAGCTSVASVYAPISFPPLHLIVLKSTPLPAVAALGELKSINPDRIILKKIILTGYPQRVSKLKAVVRYMFHNPEDVKWFKPVELWTKCGRRGRIKEPVGTHGRMKCLFNGILQQHDTACMSLYKRAYPKWVQNHFQVS